MKRLLIPLLLVSLLCSGCGWFQGSYLSVTPHEMPSDDRSDSDIYAADYEQLLSALRDMVRTGKTTQVIYIPDYPEESVEADLNRALEYLQTRDPIGAYAVEEISCELGSSGAMPAIALEGIYRHDAAQLQKLVFVQDMDAAEEKISAALENVSAGLVLLVENYRVRDLQQFVQNYAQEHPDAIMESPELVAQAYPEIGSSRVLELRFNYQNSREDLRMMQQQVAPVFTSAVLYVSGDDAQLQKFSQLYALLLERFDEYQIKTSMTPAYSLLRHGVGDSRAFASVYARMCTKAGLNCGTVSGTRDGQSWYWNMVSVGGHNYHLDLLDVDSPGVFRLRTDDEMDLYVWDYSAYPACTGAPGENIAIAAEIAE